MLALSMGAASARTQISYKFQDEFNGGSGSAPDRSKWNYDLGSDNWGNNEIETYTNSRANSFQDGRGNLVIRVLKTRGGYTSARLKTNAIAYHGTWEARIKLNVQQGTWPAWWAMGSGLPWPQGGEIDFMENYGWENSIEASVHTPTGVPYEVRTKDQTRNISSGYHTYRMTWDDSGMRFSVDGTTFMTCSPNDPAVAPWVFSSGTPLFMLLNVAVGGAAGTPPSSTRFPVDMLVDCLRVW